MSQVLYRQYRPKKFGDVVGQEHVVKTITNQLKNNQIAHAYLFTGARGIGKTSIARILARAANCSNPKGHEPDNECEICKEILEGKSLDLVEMDAASNRRIEDVRDLKENISIPPTKSKYRTFIIDEVHMLTREAFNALLKTLEEPPSHVLFILATTEVHKIPVTILSRTQRFDFRNLKAEQIEKHLNSIVKKEGLKVDPEIVSAISQSVDGSMRDALVLLEKATHLYNEKDADTDAVQKLLGITPVKYRTDLLELLKKSDLTAVADFFEKLKIQGYNLEQFTKDFLETLRSNLAEKMDTDLAAMSEYFLQAYKELKVSPIKELPLMIASVKFVNYGKTVSPPKEEPNKSPETKHTAQNKRKKAENLKGAQEGHIQMSDVEAKWVDILGRVRKYNQSLLTALKLAEPVGSVNGSLTIAFPYKFHADTVNAAKNRLVVERVVEEIFGQKISVNCIMKRDINNTKKKPTQVTTGNDASQEQHTDKNGGNDKLIKSAIDILGGEVMG